jgi:NAD kinase
MTSQTPRVVVVTRPTELEALLELHGTVDQASFFLKSRGRTLDEVRLHHELLAGVLTALSQSVPVEWRRTRVKRSDLSRFVFEPDDIVVPVGQDGLVPNVAKYLEGQVVVGINPAPDEYEGVLVRHSVDRAAEMLTKVAIGKARVEERTMVEVAMDDGQRLLALNEAFIGHVSHQSARYRIQYRNKSERHSSSGLIVATGTGASGWTRSIQQQRANRLELPRPTAPSLAFMVREAFPAMGLGTSIAQGVIGEEETLEIVCEQESGAAVFGDGIEDDRLEPRWGQLLKVSVAGRRLHLAVG